MKLYLALSVLALVATIALAQEDQPKNPFFRNVMDKAKEGVKALGEAAKFAKNAGEVTFNVTRIVAEDLATTAAGVVRVAGFAGKQLFDHIKNQIKNEE